MAVNPVDSVKAESEPSRTQVTHSAKSSSVSFSLGELIDIINPLQHIPGVNTLYREITGDEASVRARVAGSSMYGLLAGPLGMAGLVAGNLAEMKISGVLDAEPSQNMKTASVDVIEQKLQAQKTVPEPAPDMARSLQPGTPIIPVSSRDIPALFGNVALSDPLMTGSDDKLIEALSGKDESEEEAAKLASNEPINSLPEVDKLSADARNLLPDDILRLLQERHHNTIIKS